MGYAEIIKAICKRKNVTLSELAEQLGVKYQSLSKAINQDYPQLQTLERISIVLDCEMSEIITGAQNSFHCPHCGKVIHITKQEEK